MLEEDNSYYQNYFIHVHQFNEWSKCAQCGISLARLNKLKSLGFKLYPGFESTYLDHIRDADSIERVNKRLVVYNNSSGQNESFKTFEPMTINNFNLFEIKFIDATYNACDFEISIEV